MDTSADQELSNLGVLLDLTEKKVSRGRSRQLLVKIRIRTDTGHTFLQPTPVQAGYKVVLNLVVTFANGIT